MDLNFARNIDVIWFRDDDNSKFCFGVEHNIDINGGSNRLSQF